MMYLRVRNWEEFQHYKDRDPPWIKLHRNLLTSRTWVSLDDASRTLAIAIMLLAAGTDNKIPADKAYLRRVAYLNSDPDWNPLVQTQFIDLIDESGELLAGASTTLAPDTKCSSEERRVEESRGEEKRSAPPPRRNSRKAKSELPEDFNLTDDLRTYAESKLPQVDAVSLFEGFCGKARAKSWVYADWRQAWQEFCRNAAPNSGHWSSGQFPRKAANGRLTVESLEEQSGWR